MREREFKFRVTTPPSEELIKEFIIGVLKDGVVAEFGREAVKEALRQIEERDSRKVTVKQ